MRPDTTLAQAAGLRVGDRGGIAVDEHFRTSAPDVYAVHGQQACRPPQIQRQIGIQRRGARTGAIFISGGLQSRFVMPSRRQHIRQEQTVSCICIHLPTLGQTQRLQKTHGAALGAAF